MKARHAVLMLGLDAAEWTVVQQLMDAGKMPALASLRAQGSCGELRSPARSFAGGVWPSFYTGQDVPWHGIFHNKLWRPDAMRCEVPGERWIGSRPFWEHLGKQGYRVCIVDVPMILGKPPATNGLYLGGWGTHDLISKGSWPGDLWRELRRRHGAPVMPPEFFGPQTPESLGRLTESLLRATEQMQAIACRLLEREQWDFACIVFGSTHRVGHYLWDLSQLDQDSLADAQREALGAAMTRIYEATDHAISRVIEKAGPGTLAIAFAVHGMGPNPGWSDLVPDMLEAGLGNDGGHRPGKGLFYTLRRRLPFRWVRPVLRSLPAAATERLVTLWSARMYDWKSTQYFPVPMDHAGYVRVNLRSRERDGIVDPGASYDTVCHHIETMFRGLRDQETGEQVAPQVLRGYAESNPGAAYRELVPDIVIPWEGPSAVHSSGLYHDSWPSFRFDVPQRLPSGRSGNHTGRGWFIASGPGVAANERVAGHDILDLAPTVMCYLGADPPRGLHGAPIALRGRDAG